MRFRAVDVARATGGTLVGPDVELDGVSFDSRSTRAGQLFVPIIAERDGHEFVGGARARGAAAYLTSHPSPGDEGTRVEVPDTLRALMDLATAQRRTFTGDVIGITGSVGKTSTKDLALAALAACRPTWANERSFNNDQGLPTTILNMPAGTEVLVLEMGMRGPGEIARLCAIGVPDIGVVTRVAEAHGDLLGGIDAVARAKAELIQCLPPAGTAILNADDPRVRAMATKTEATVITFGSAGDADVRITDVVLDDLARASFRLHTPSGIVPVRLRVSGAHMAVNAAAALACVVAVGADLHAGAAALEDAALSAMRMQTDRAPGGALILDDSYNANPTSMRAALDALAAIPAERRIAVLGLMAEISDSEAEHRTIAANARDRGIQLIAVGTTLYGGTSVLELDEVVAALGPLAGGDAVLVKGSRVAGLDRVAAALRSA